MSSRGRTRAIVGLAVTAALLCLAPVGQAAVTRTFAATAAIIQPQVAFQGFDGNPPSAFDVDGDGRKEILVQNDNHYLYVLNSATGAKLAEIKTTIPPGWGARTFNGPEAYRDADGLAHLVLTNSAAYVTSYRYNAAGSTPTSFQFVKEWERRTTDCFPNNPGMDAKPTLADLDRDGRFEILVAVEESGIVALRHDGTLYWKKCIGGGNAEPVAGDLNLDGWLDVVFGSDGGVVTAMNGRTGATMWSYYAPGAFNIGPGSMPVGVAIGQVDGLGGLDVVVGARDAHDATNFTNNHALLLALSSGGSLLWGRQDANGGNPLTYTRPIIADADGDGRNEVYWADWNTMGHKPPPPDSPDAWKVMGPSNTYRYSHTGQLVWKQTLGSFWSNKDIALIDMDGDGQQEVLANGPNNGRDGIWSLDSATGAKEQFVDLYPWMMSRMAIAHDLGGDGGMDLVVETGPMATSQGPAIHVYDTGVPYSALWPHIPDPVLGTPPPPPPPPAGCFSATFTVQSPNTWWQQVTVQPQVAKTITKVQVRFPGHEWQPMTKNQWGAWTSSYNTPTGTPVEFLATSSDNFVSQSLPFTWMDGTTTRGSTNAPCSGGTTSSSSSSGPSSSPSSSSSSPSPSSSSSSSSSSTSSSSTSSSSTSFSSSESSSSSTSGGPFTATFAGVRGNEWWVQADVSGTSAVAQVDARVNGGAWRPLTKQTWSPTAWAASFQVPQGSQVQLRATSTGGTSDLSDQCYQWIPPSNQDAATVACGTGTTTSSSSGTTTGGTFTAGFTPVAVGNDWWVEARVTANEPVAAVHVMYGSSGTWMPLDLQSWGNWAKSIHTPNGTPVNFRATSSDGDLAFSTAPTIWT